MTKFFKSFSIKLKGFENFINKIDHDEIPPSEEIKTRILNLEKVYVDFENGLTDLIEKTDEVQIDNLQPSVEKIENKYCKIRANLNSLVKTCNLEDGKTFNTKIQMNSVKLPHINLPVFNGSPTEWLTFKDTFLSVVHRRTDIDDIVKFTILIEKLTEDAKETIGHVTLSAAGYQKAWSELVRQYDDERIIVDVHVDAILSLPNVPRDNASQLRKFLNACVFHIPYLEACNQVVDGLGELFIINIIIKKLDASLRKEWESELLPNTLPKWPQLKKFLMKNQP